MIIQMKYAIDIFSQISKVQIEKMCSNSSQLRTLPYDFKK